MDTEALQFEVVYPRREDAEAAQVDIQYEGAEAEIKEEPGLLPLAVLLVVAVPPGLALLIKTVDRAIHGWKDHGILIDARGTGAPRIVHDESIAYGTVVTITRDGDEAIRTELPEEKLSDYVGGAVKAISGGASATEAAAQATNPKD